jgi:hypothetical protein
MEIGATNKVAPAPLHWLHDDIAEPAFKLLLELRNCGAKVLGIKECQDGDPKGLGIPVVLYHEGEYPSPPPTKHLTAQRPSA